ncbi:TLDc domain-containing protein [Entamoeba marina]
MEDHKDTIKFINDVKLNQYNSLIKSSLEWSVFNKQNLYFISFDNETNVFGGYLNETINIKNTWIPDCKAFVFSLIRNGKVKNKKDDIKKGNERTAFWLISKSNMLYFFGKYDRFGYTGCDIVIPTISSISGYSSKPVIYEYNDKKQPLRDEKRGYSIIRIFVLKMN